MERIKALLINCQAVSNRLEVKNIMGKIIIDDSYNSNKEGFIEAINVLKEFPSKQVVITPGVVTGGEMIPNINKEIALKLCESNVFVYLVKSISMQYLKNVFDEKYQEYCVVSSFKEAYKHALKEVDVKTILIENDITDYYKE